MQLTHPEVGNFHQCKVPSFADEVSEVNGMKELTNTMSKIPKVRRAAPIKQVQDVGMCLMYLFARKDHVVELQTSGKMGAWREQGDCCLKDLTEDIEDLELEIAKGHVSTTSIAHHDLPVPGGPRLATEFRQNQLW